MGRQGKKPTQEEIERDKPIILKMFQEGLPMRRMQVNLGMCRSYIMKIRDLLISEGLITQEEIKKAHNKYMAENPPAQGLDKTKVRQKSNTEKSDARRKISLARRENVFKLVKQGKSRIEIANELQVTETAISWDIKQLIKEGRIVEGELVKISPGETAVQIDKSTPEFISKRDEVVKYLKLGWKYFAIRKVLNITPFYMNVYIKDIKNKGIMTSAEIELLREKKKNEDLVFLENHINLGNSVDSFRELKPEISYNEVTSLIKELISEGRVTQEQIEVNRRKAINKSINKNVQMSHEEQINFIIDKLKKGYTPKEIVDSDKTNSLTMYKVLYQKRRIIAQGIISQEDADKAMEKRQNRKVSRKHNKIIKIIKEYTMQGYTIQEMAETVIHDYTYEYLLKLKNDYVKENGWFTAEEIKEFIRKRKIREYEVLPQEEKDRIEEEKKQKEREEEQIKIQKAEAEEQRKMEQIWHLRELTALGLTNDEICQRMHYSMPYILQLKRIAKQKNIWFSEKNLKFFKNRRAKQEEKEETKRQKQEQRKLEKERREFENTIKAMEREKSKRNRRYEELRNAASQEYKLEMNGEENVSTDGRKHFVRWLIEQYEKGEVISNEDTEIIINSFYLHTDFINKKNLRFLIGNANRSNGIIGVNKILGELTSVIEGTDYSKSWYLYKKWIKQQMIIPEIKRLREQGLSNDSIGDALEISSAEVVVYLAIEGNEVDFFGEDRNR